MMELPSLPEGSVLGPQGFIAYTEDLTELLGHHMYANDTQLMAHLTINDIPSVAKHLKHICFGRHILDSTVVRIRLRKLVLQE